MTEEKKAKWKKVGETLKNVGAKTIGGYLQGGFVGAGVEILGEFLGKKKNGVNPFPSDVDSLDPDSVLAEVESLSAAELIELKRFDTEKAVAAIQAEQAFQSDITSRHESDNATDSRFVKLTRPGIAWKWSTVGMFLAIAPLFGWVSDESESVYRIAIWFTASILGGIILFYFGSRGTEKVAAILGNRFGESPLDKIKDILKNR